MVYGGWSNNDWDGGGWHLLLGLACRVTRPTTSNNKTKLVVTNYYLMLELWMLIRSIKYELNRNSRCLSRVFFLI